MKRCTFFFLQGKLILLLLILFICAVSSAAATKRPLIAVGDFDYFPYTFIDKETNLPAGHDVDLAREISNILNRDVDVHLLEWRKAQEMIHDGSADIIMSILHTEEREERFDFTIPYHTEYYAVFVHKNSVIEDLADLEGKVIIGLRGDASVDTFIRPMGLYDKAILVDSLPFALKMLDEGKGEFAVAPYGIGRKTIVSNDLNNIKVVGPPILPSFYRFAVKKGNHELLAELNEAIDQIKISPKMRELEKKWFQYRRHELTAAMMWKYVAWVGAPILLVIVALFFWSWTLKLQVKRKTADLNHSRMMLELVLDNIPQRVFWKDKNGTYLGCNRAFLQDAGADSPVKIIGKKDHDMYWAEQAETFRGDDLRIMGSGKPELDYNEPLTVQGEKTRWLKTNKIPLTNEDGKIIGILGTYEDITREKEILEELVEAREQADKANAAKSDFLATMSHEIRTPMNGVIGMTGLLLDTELADDQRHYAETIKSSGESLLGLINDILDFSKIEAGKLDLETLDFDLGSLLDDFAAGLALKTHDKGLELVCAADLDVPTLLRGDPGRLRQVLTNLTGNAVKFTHRGEVSVRVAMAHRQPEEGEGVLLRFSVRDTGIGIASDKLGLLFNQFSQLDASTTRQYGGTGLGLAISKQLAEMMGGEIGVESVPGKGSEFWFTARFEKQTHSELAVPPVPANLLGVRILIVDDNATNREILMTRLASWGMRPEETSDGNQALQSLERAVVEGDPFRLAVIDMQMPGMDGSTLGRAIQADLRLKDVRMVMLTSLGARGDAKIMADSGFAGYLNKPVRHQELYGVLALALGGQVSAAQPIATRHAAREVLPAFHDRRARILVAEDNITNQQVALGILRKLGLRADAVANGREALEALKTLPYDLVLMDVQMPEMDGLEATRHIRDPRSPVPMIPVVAMTAHAMQSDKERCLEAGMNDYLTKPVSALALAQVLEKWLPGESAGMSRKTE